MFGNEKQQPLLHSRLFTSPMATCADFRLPNSYGISTTWACRLDDLFLRSYGDRYMLDIVRYYNMSWKGIEAVPSQVQENLTDIPIHKDMKRYEKISQMFPHVLSIQWMCNTPSLHGRSNTKNFSFFNPRDWKKPSLLSKPFTKPHRWTRKVWEKRHLSWPFHRFVACFLGFCWWFPQFLLFPPRPFPRFVFSSPSFLKKLQPKGPLMW